MDKEYTQQVDLDLNTKKEDLITAFLVAVGETNFEVGKQRVEESLQAKDATILNQHYPMIYLVVPCYENRLDGGFIRSLTAPDLPNCHGFQPYEIMRNTAYLTAELAREKRLNRNSIKSYPQVGIPTNKINNLLALLKDGHTKLPSLKKEEIDLSKNKTATIHAVTSPSVTCCCM